MTDLPHREQAMVTLLEEAACQRLISTYSAAIDWADREGLARLFWPDTKLDFGAAFFVGSGTAGVDFLIASVQASLCRTHTLGATWLKIDKGRARAETPAVNVWISRNPDGSITRYLLTVRYLWELQKRGDEWRISSLKMLVTTAQCTPYDMGAQPPGLSLLEGLNVDHPMFPGVHS